MNLTSFLKQTGSSVIYRPELVKITGSINATIFLDQLIYWSDGLKKVGEWIYMTQDVISKRVGLTRFEQEGARKKLKSRGFLNEKYSGVPRKLYYKLNEDAINEAWEKHQKSLENQHNAEKPHSRPRKTNNQASRKNTGLDAETPQTYKQYPKPTSNNTSNQRNSESVIISILLKTPFSRVPKASIQKFIEQYGFDHVFHTADILVYQSRKGKSIEKPSGYFSQCLMKDMLPPEGYIPYAERLVHAEALQQRKASLEAETAAKKAQEEAQNLSKIVLWESLSEEMREKYRSEVLAGMPANMPSELLPDVSVTEMAKLLAWDNYPHG